MTSVRQASISVKAASPRRGPGQPSKQTPERIQAINRAVVQAALSGDEIPSDVVLAGEHGVSERTVRNIRLRTLGLNRHELRQWQQRGRRDFSTRRSAEPELVCTTPFAGLWLLVPQIIDSGLARAGCFLRVVQRTRVQAIQVVLTLIAWSALGFRRLFHVDDFRDWADMGLALFTGALHLWSDTTLGRWVHGATPESVLAFYQATAGQAAGHSGSRGRFSLDETSCHRSRNGNPDRWARPAFRPAARRILPSGCTRPSTWTWDTSSVCWFARSANPPARSCPTC